MRFVKTVAFCLIFPASTLNAQIPTTDIVNLVNNIASQLENLAQIKLQYDVLMNQLDQAKKSYDKLEEDLKSNTGRRHLAAYAFNSKFQNTIAADFATTLSKIRKLGKAGLSAAAKAHYEANNLFDMCDLQQNAELKNICYSKVTLPSQIAAYNDQAISTITERSAQIQTLMAKANETEDPKEIAEISARINAEVAFIANEQTKLDMFRASAENEQRIADQQLRELTVKTMSSKVYPDRKPLSFK